MDPMKIPKQSKDEYDELIKRQFVSRIAFIGPDNPYIAPFMYVFDGKYLYFLSSRYGRKMKYMQMNSRVSVEIEEYSSDLSTFRFVSLQGFLEEVLNEEQIMKVKGMFVEMIQKNSLSSHILTAFGYSADDDPMVITRENRCALWKLKGVTDIVALKNG
ncbi:pyridoxamine 5'-phosphate oxidase family protein [Methanospirillum lacunae]|uniref:Pyridoxamine 5'-phosphate oxidase n=1 Tax=Methanospirillum lacunae TaxID=668570 RepID=A0A2V2N297_9EURY|nr:pyridoxamine 5'-phosphate oxidase family protein [Methanospirillum lacunae]PWR73889.1 pyridoxamine 5'-phosphate oxidase [Methanospirillum lacunae]